MTSAGNNLRHRRNKSSSQSDATEPPLVQEENHDKSKDHDSGEESSNNDGYVLTPLMQRSMLTRLDVGPFAVIYAVLIYVDYYSDLTTRSNNSSAPETETTASLEDVNILLQPLTWLFALVIFSHVMLVLMQQWNVHVRCLVGYQRAPTQVASSTLQPSTTGRGSVEAEALIASWTHCLVVEGGASAGGNSASQNNGDALAGAGIAPVKVETTTQNSQQQQVAIVDFHDISFRCPIVPKSLDQDILLWKSKVNKDVEANTAKSDGGRTNLLFHRVRFPVQLPISFYGTWKGHSSLESIVQCQRLYGANATKLDIPTFGELLGEQVVAPFFLFQMFCVALWSLDEYWYYAIFTLLALLSFESTVAYNRKQGLQRLRNASRQNNHQKLWAHRPGFSPSSPWIKISVQEIVPGDVLSLTSEPAISDGRGGESTQHNSVPADLLLLKGNAVVDEALLTGESIPQIKAPFDPSTSTVQQLDIQEHKEAMLFGGTVLLTADFGDSNQDAATSNSKGGNDDKDISRPPDDGVVGIVLRTGFETAQGSLLRTIAHSSKSVDGIHTLDTFVFIFILICCAIFSASLVLQDGWEDVTRNRFRLVLHVVIIITSVVPPELPMELSLAVTNSVADLMKRCQVFCTEHYRIPWAGLVDVCALDKTGTITSDQMRLKGIRLFVDGDLDPLDEEGALVKAGETDSEILPWSAVRVMAGCHSLALRVTRGKNSIASQMIGDPLEQAVLKDTGYQLVGNNMLIPTQLEPGRPKSMTILHRFAFASQLKRMTVLVTEENSATEKDTIVWALTKGAPETIFELLSPESTPTDYDKIYTYHMSKGRRVLAMAYRSLGTGRSLKSLKEMGRDKIEKKLLFAGFLILDCPLKPDSRSVIAEIRQSDHRVVMITGDSVLTAAEVSRQVGIIPTTARDGQKQATYWLQELEGEALSKANICDVDVLSRFAFVPLLTKKGSESIVASQGNFAKLKSMSNNGSASFCLTGDILAKVAMTVLNTPGDKEKSATWTTTNEKSTLLHPQAQSVLKELVQLVSVFARHAPHQKEAVVAAFNLSGHYTLYCGDGTNVSLVFTPRAFVRKLFLSRHSLFMGLFPL